MSKTPTPEQKATLRVWSLRLALQFVLMAALLFGLAHTLAWPMAWLYLIIRVITQTVITALLWRRAPDLLQERLRPGEGTKPWDRWLVSLSAAILPTVSLAMAGTDRGLDLSPVPFWLQAVGLAFTALAEALLAWAMAHNAFFSSVVRLQVDRGQRVVSSGPYAFVRHPGYLSSLILGLAGALMLGSWLCLVVSVVNVPVLVRRTALEDRTLQTELEGYLDYTRRTRYRLIPGLW